MAVFDFDEDMIASVIGSALEDAGSRASEEQFSKIIEAIDDSMPGIISILTYGMQEHWKSEAKGVSTGWGEKYAEAIKAKVSDGQGEVFLDEEMIDPSSGKPNMFFANLVENGMVSFSIKDALMKSDKVKIGADGVRYISVPFPVATPRKAGQGKMQSKFGGREMSAEVHKIVKSGGKVKVSGDMAGLTKFQTRKLHEGYGIFRRVSEKSMGFVHPGVAKEPVYKKVLDEVNKRVAEVLSEYCKAIVKEYT